MLSYRHAFHAGNHADVLKHIALVAAMRLMGRKEKGFLAADTHAGAGAYALREGYSAQNEEWAAGIGRLRDRFRNADADAPAAIGDYLAALREFAAAEGRSEEDAYPGSPALIAGLLRPQDRAVFSELHGSDRSILSERFAGNKAIQVRTEDGFSVLKALLPPPSRRGLALIDPSYELAEDYDRAVSSLEDSLRRFATGVYMLWYPILERREARELPERLARLSAPVLHIRLQVRASRDGERGMAGSGLYILNPPYTFQERMAECLPVLVEVLRQDEGAGWEMEKKEEKI